MAAKTSRRKHGAARQARRAAARANGHANGATNGLNGKQTSGLVFVINMIPRSLSGETSQDSEPHLTVNPSNRKQIVGTAFTPDPAGGPRAPIYISPNAGLTWKLNSIVPSVAGSIGTADITTGFSGKSSRLYAGILNAGNIHLQFLRTLNPFTPTPMTVLSDRANADQPFTHATKKGAEGARLHRRQRLQRARGKDRDARRVAQRGRSGAGVFVDPRREANDARPGRPADASGLASGRHGLRGVLSLAIGVGQLSGEHARDHVGRRRRGSR